MSTRTKASRLLVAAALRGQRLGRVRALLPAAARARLNRLMAGWVDRSDPTDLLDDWSQPLLPDPVSTRHAPAAPLSFAERSVSVGMSPPRPQLRGDAPRCLLVTAALDAGGMDEMVAFLARRLPSQGLRVAVLHAVQTCDGAAPEGRICRMLRHAGAEVAVLPESDGRRWIRRWRPDVISAHGAPAWVLDEASSMGVPYVDVLHGMHSHFDADWAAESTRGQSVAAIVAVSELVRRQYLAHAPDFPAENIITIPNGVDDERRRRVDRSSARAALGLRDEYLFASLARHCLQKNTFALVSAFDEVAAAHPHAHLLVAGRADDALYCAQVRRLRNGLHHRNRIHLREHASLPGLVLSAADGFVMNSYFEGWALASMEALHAGVPVVTSDVGGATEQLGESGQRGYVVANPLGDPLAVNWERMRTACYERQVNRGELVRSMGALVRDRAHWASIRESLAAESEERFHPDSCVRAHAALLTSLAGRATLISTGAR